MATPLGELLGSSPAEMEAEFADYAAMGVDWIRTDFWWNLAQPTANGAYDWSQMDKVVAMAQKYGIEVIAELNGYPSWVGPGMSTTASQTAFGNFAAAAAAHFGTKVNHWEIYNEPNTNGISPENYTKILKAAYTAIKAVDASDMVITGGTAAVPSTGNGLWGAVDYLQKMYAAGAKGFFDAVGYHPYTYPLLPDDPAAWNGWQIMEDGIRTTMVANGDSEMQIWMTELGAPTAGGAAAMSQADQAKIISQATAFASDHAWAGPIMWYSYKDRGGSTTDTENWFGLVGPNGQHKAAYDTFVAIAKFQELTPTFSTQKYTGAATSDIIVGNTQDNTIWSGAGNDTVRGGNGNDLIVGQEGSDVMWGDNGADRFMFTDVAHVANDLIKDFRTGDTIDLRGLDANALLSGNQAFKFVGSAWLAKAGDLGVYYDKTHDWTSVQGDANGDGKPDFSLRVDGQHDFVAGDFLL